MKIPMYIYMQKCMSKINAVPCESLSLPKAISACLVWLLWASYFV
jgi:hypothetical protein